MLFGLGLDLEWRLCFQIEIELIFSLNPNLAPSEPPSVIPSKLSRVSATSQPNVRLFGFKGEFVKAPDDLVIC